MYLLGLVFAEGMFRIRIAYVCPSRYNVMVRLLSIWVLQLIMVFKILIRESQVIYVLILVCTQFPAVI